MAFADGLHPWRQLGVPAGGEVGDTESMANRFLLSAIAFLRTKQLKEGARSRVENAGHKATYLAVLEVLANTISWSRD